MERLAADGVTLKYIFETHFHADFVSGHVSLAEQTGAEIIYGPTAMTSYKSRNAVDEEVFNVGNLTIKAMHTPGHTIESTCYLLSDKDGKAHCIFTGDTLFLGDVGRPDLSQKGAELTIDDLAGMLYDSLRQKIMPLPDDILVYPAHGAGSACGKNMMKITVDSLGNQREVNYALRADMTKKEFITEVTDGLGAAPAYFPLNVKLNKEGYNHMDSIIEKGNQPLSPSQFESIQKGKQALVLDVRAKEAFAQAHIPGSIFIGIDGSFAPWVGAIIADIEKPILLVSAEGREEETITRLSRVGFDNTLGYLDGGIVNWKKAGKATSHVNQISAEELLTIDSTDTTIMDMRKPGEYASAHVDGFSNLPLSELQEKLDSLPQDKTFYEHCQSGYRSMIAASIIKASGNDNVVDVIGGFKALKEKGATIIAQQCSTTLKEQ